MVETSFILNYKYREYNSFPEFIKLLGSIRKQLLPLRYENKYFVAFIKHTCVLTLTSTILALFGNNVEKECGYKVMGNGLFMDGLENPTHCL